jgi:predicted signal transduction protein with EAL and GGDEF domain
MKALNAWLRPVGLPWQSKIEIDNAAVRDTRREQQALFLVRAVPAGRRELRGTASIESAEKLAGATDAWAQRRDKVQRWLYAKAVRADENRLALRA